ncbi:metallophosphoesterase [Bartonella sp. OD88NMGDW]|uniref:metallophosphoesterase n=1 Tax=Bartonella sp. OD88NMGDW TaxID=3243571 RepID=UPI0035CF16AD
MRYKVELVITVIAFTLSGCFNLDSEKLRRDNRLYHDAFMDWSMKEKSLAKNYTAIIMADPQPWRLNSGDANGISNREPWLKINEQVAGVIKAHKAAFHIVNGDLTEFGQQKNYDDYENVYKTLGAPVYEGLGNHDYANNVGNCTNPQEFSFYKDACAISAVSRMVSEIKKYRNQLLHFNADVTESLVPISGGNIRSIRGSLSYSWDYGDVHYVQLHNYPSYTVRLMGQSVQAQINKSLDWLRNDLTAADARGNVTIIIKGWIGSIDVREFLPSFLGGTTAIQPIAQFAGAGHANPSGREQGEKERSPITHNQNVTVHVNGARDPVATARAVAHALQRARANALHGGTE